MRFAVQWRVYDRVIPLDLLYHQPIQSALTEISIELQGEGVYIQVSEYILHETYIEGYMIY